MFLGCLLLNVMFCGCIAKKVAKWYVNWTDYWQPFNRFVGQPRNPLRNLLKYVLTLVCKYVGLLRGFQYPLDQFFTLSFIA
jgi:hypothetical protein